jgi:pyruvate formate lyase activating enzyme
MIQASHFKKLDNKKVQCELCKFKCIIKNNNYGICKVRKNIEGILYSETYEKVLSISMDPVEKKPFFHVKPGGKALSYCTAGCNFDCPWCQNYSISQYPSLKETRPLPGEPLSPQEIVAQAIVTKADIIAATYTEPTVFFEFSRDIMILAYENNIKNGWVTNGSISQKPLEEIAPYLDCVNVDLKGFDTNILQMKPEKVMETIKQMHNLGIWIEITTLIVPEVNNQIDQLEKIAKFISSLDVNIPWHISRYFPVYKYKQPPTKIIDLKNAFEAGKKFGLNYIYTGNINMENSENTYCPNCETLLIKRDRYTIQKNILKKAMCPNCKTSIPGIF